MPIARLDDAPVEPPQLTTSEMQRLVGHAFGSRGAHLADCWDAYNRAFFDGQLAPVPVLLVPSTPFGAWSSLTTYQNTWTLHLQVKAGLSAPAARGALLHAMVHQALVERGERPEHDGNPWRREIERLSDAVYGIRVSAAGTRIAKVREPSGRRRSVRRPPDASNGHVLDDAAIAAWPSHYRPQDASTDCEHRDFPAPPAPAALDHTLPDVDVPALLAQAMREQGLSQNTVATALGISRSHLANLKNRHRRLGSERARVITYLTDLGYRP